MFATLGFLYYTTLGFLVVVLIGVILGILARKKKKFITVKPTGTVSKLYKTVEGVHPTFQKSYNFQQEFQQLPPFQTHKIEGYKEYKCPICEHEKEKGIKEKPKSLSDQAIEEIKKKEDARVFEEINKKGIHLKSSYGHHIVMRDLPEFPTCTTDPCGNKIWRNKEGQFHREDGPAVVYPNGNGSWYLNNTWYTEEDWKKELISRQKPSEYPKCTTDVNGNKAWTNKEGKLHREDGPAVEHRHGYKSWYLNDKWHREDGPAIEFADGRKSWCLNGTIYTEELWKKELDKRNSLECSDKLLPNGNRVWSNKEGKLHREDGPAFIGKDGSKSWYINGKCHREDGPAVEFVSGTKWWYLNDKRYSEENWKQELVTRRWKITPDNEDYWIPTRPNNPVNYSGVKKWFDGNGKLHNKDGPAVIFPDGTKSWYINGQAHREDGPAIEWYNGYKEWYLNGKQYSERTWKEELDKPKNKKKNPKTDKNGNIKWTNKDGRWHREDGPAVIYTNGTKAWWLNGKQHREDGPAVEFADGRKHCWYLNGKKYSEADWKKELNKPKCETDEKGNKKWTNKEGQIHREDGPAYEYAVGNKFWYINGKLHREDGPAIEYYNGFKEWALDGTRYYTEEEWKIKLELLKQDRDTLNILARS